MNVLSFKNNLPFVIPSRLFTNFTLYFTIILIGANHIWFCPYSFHAFFISFYLVGKKPSPMLLHGGKKKSKKKKEIIILRELYFVLSITLKNDLEWCTNVIHLNVQWTIIINKKINFLWPFKNYIHIHNSIIFLILFET